MRPGGHRIDGFGHEPGLMRHDRHVLQPVRRRGNRAVLGIQRAAQHGPAAVDLTESVFVVDANVAVVDDVGAVAVDGADALDLDARRNRAAPGTWSGSCVLRASGSVLVIRKTYWQLCAPVVNIFEPLMTHWSPSRTARVLQVAMSDPPSGSV